MVGSNSQAQVSVISALKIPSSKKLSSIEWWKWSSLIKTSTWLDIETLQGLKEQQVNHFFFFTILTERKYVLLNSVHGLIEIEARLLLTFFLCLRDQATHQIDRKWTVAPVSIFNGKILVGFCQTFSWKRFLLQILF